MKKGWEIKRLPNIAEYFIGLTYSPKDVSTKGIIVLRSSNIQNDELDLSDLVRVTCSVKKPLIVRNGDILMCSRNGSKRLLGKTAMIGNLSEEMTFGTFMTVIRSELNPYLSWFFRSEAFRDQIGVGENTMINQITKYMLDTIRVPVPPLPEQQRIVGILDKAFAGLAVAVANAEKNLQNARALFESHLQSVFTQRGEGWEEKPFSELCDIKHGYAFEGEFFSKTGDYVLLTPGNFYEQGGYRDRGEKQKYYTGIIPRDYVLSEGDLLVAMTEQAAGLLGSAILVPESDKFLHNQRLGLVTKKAGVPWTNEFFFHVFNTQSVRRAIHASASGVKVRHTSPTKIGEVVVSFPTRLSEQTHIVSTLSALTEETQRLAAIYERKLAALLELKKSLLHQAFSGEL